jgi:shikimate dehydrogenase
MRKEVPKIYGILGSDIAYSLSPQIFKALFDQYKLPHGYFLFDTKRQKLADFVESARSIGIAGYNVTIPFKCDIMSHLDSVHSSARCCRAANLVIMRGRKLTGYNVDLMGIDDVFREARMSSVAKKRVLLIGAGGTARTMLMYILAHKPAEVSVVNRSRRRLLNMLSELGVSERPRGIEACRLPALRSRLRDSSWDTIFNATPVETAAIVPDTVIRRAEAVFEAAYGSVACNILRGPKLVGGVDMLIFQALRGFEILTGINIENRRRMKAIVKRKLSA